MPALPPYARLPAYVPPHLVMRCSPQERKKLALTLKDAKSVVSKLELVCGVVIHIAFLLLYLWVFEVRPFGLEPGS